jgi:hypothetical protein
MTPEPAIPRYRDREDDTLSQPRRTFGFPALALVLPLSIALTALGCGPDASSGPTVEDPPALAVLPEFLLLDPDGAPYGSDDLFGRPWLAAFDCGEGAPDVAVEGVDVVAFGAGGATGGDIRLHGTRDQLAGLWSEAPGWTGAGDPASCGRLYLVDAERRIRGAYPTDGEQAVLADDVKKLLAEPPPTVLYHPAVVEAPEWLDQRRADQLATAGSFNARHDFGFVDSIAQSGIAFQHRITDDSGKYRIPVHYDHGTGVVAADVDGDELVDLYFVNQLPGSELWKNLGDGTFSNITESAGVAVDDRTTVGAAFADIDNDGDADLYVTSVGFPNVLFENDGAGHFTDVSGGSGVDYSGHSSSAVFFDYDRDGLLDLYLCVIGVYTQGEARGRDGYYVGREDAFWGHQHPDRAESSRLYRNLGGGRFEDVTEAVGLTDTGWTGAATPIDGNADGWPDLYALNMQGNDEYWVNEGGERFVRKRSEVFPKTAWGAMGVKAFDFENDGDQDLFVTDMHSDMIETPGPEREALKNRRSQPEEVLLTEGMSVLGNAFFRQEDGVFEEVSDQIGAENFWPWGLSVGDLNADGYLDAFIASSMNYPFRYGINSVLLNEGGERFVPSEFLLAVEPRAGNRTAKPWFSLDCSGEDADHVHCSGEGKVIGERRLLGRIRDALSGRDDTLSGRVVVWGAVGTRSSVLLDLEGDGDLDIVTNEFGDRPMVLVSDLAERHDVRYLGVSLAGVVSNRSGIGAVVTVEAGGRTLTQTNDGQSGYLGQSDRPLYFGLGNADSVDSIRVVWPSGTKQVVPGPLETNRHLLIEEAAG